MKASAAYTVENLRNAEFTKQNGVEASIMDYGRYNYVAQPGDGAALIPIVAPYDYFAVDWGYRQYASKEEEDKGTGGTGGQTEDRPDPAVRRRRSERRPDASDRGSRARLDRSHASGPGQHRSRRRATWSQPPASRTRTTSLLSNMYDQLLAQRNRELAHVTAMVGGFEQINLFFGDADQVYHPIPVDRQREAVAFLIQQAFQTPAKLIDPQITLRLEASGAAERDPQQPAVDPAFARQRRTTPPHGGIRRSAPAATRQPCTRPRNCWPI